MALELFSDRGYDATTITQIAAAAEIAPSTLHTYFRSKEDIIFDIHAELRESIRAHILERPTGQTFTEALLGWLSDVFPEVVAPASDSWLERHAIISENDNLVAGERLRIALLEDLFAEAVASDFGEAPTDLRSRLMASVATNGMSTVWKWWFPQLVDREFVDAQELSELDATYLVGLLDAAETALAALPKPPHHASNKSTA